MAAMHLGLRSSYKLERAYDMLQSILGNDYAADIDAGRGAELAAKLRQYAKENQ